MIKNDIENSLHPKSVSPTPTIPVTSTALSTLGINQINSTVIFLVIAWYLSANISVITAKTLLQQYPYPFLLCSVQFYTAFLLLGFVSSQFGSQKRDSWKQMHKTNKLIIAYISVAYTAGFIFTNIAFSISKTSFVETVKSAEPLSSVFLGYIFFHDELSKATLACLCIICFGVALACMGETQFQMAGFLFAVLSNLCFSLRSVYTKLYFKSFPNTLDEVVLFYYISAIGAVILIPLTLLFDGQSVLVHITVLRNENSFSISLNTISLYLLNGLAYSTYNLMSYLVLTRVVLVNHAVINGFRRVFIIVVSTFYFSITMNALNITGCVMATVGVVAYSRTR